MKTLIIVESPGKIKKIQNYVGNTYKVVASYGHIYNLKRKNMGVDVNKNFKPDYEIIKPKIAQNIIRAYKKCNKCYLATDLDREGEAIAWHLANLLKLNLNEKNRIIFNEITKDSILNALKNPKKIDKNLFNAQQTRRIIDRLVGFTLTSQLWFINRHLSAGRVQTVALKIIIDRENEIKKAKNSILWQVTGIFENNISASFSKNLKTIKESEKYIKSFKSAIYTIESINENIIHSNPPKPFITSTLQQTAGNLHGFSAKQTMVIAQKLYEKGLITYHRTDAYTLSNYFINKTKKYIIENFGKEYFKQRIYTNKKNSQEAHEAIRPTKANISKLENANSGEYKLYDMIWKRSVCTQMVESKSKCYTLKINVSNMKDKFLAKSSEILFDGYKKILNNKKIDKNYGILKKMNIGNTIKYNTINIVEKIKEPLKRFTEPALIKQLEDKGIGRPSTYANIISTLKNRQYIIKKGSEGIDRITNEFILKNKNIVKKENIVKIGKENNKLFPTELGVNICNYLCTNFDKLINYEFTAEMELKLDDIANNKKHIVWSNIIQKIYNILQKEKKNIVHMKIKKIEHNLGKYLNNDVLFKKGPYGYYLSHNNNNYSIKDEKLIEKMNLRIAQNIIRNYKKDNVLLGKYEDKDIYIKKGKYGYYINFDNKNISLKNIEKPLNLTITKAINLIKDYESNKQKKYNKTFKIKRIKK